MSTKPREQWYRVVDAHHQGWHPTVATVGGPTAYAADYGFMREGLGGHRTLDELEAERGPLRPVLPITDENAQELRAALEAAGRKAVYTVAVAVQLAFNELRELRGGLDNRGSYDATRTHLLGGREGSWESEALVNLMLWGNVEKTRRIYEPSRQVITDMIVRWVTDPARFTEVAATLGRAGTRRRRGWGTVDTSPPASGSRSRSGSVRRVR